MKKSKKNVTGGYEVNPDRTAIIGRYREVEGELPENFIASENLDDKVVRISADGKRIEEVEPNAMRPQRTAEQELERRQRRLIAQRDRLLSDSDRRLMSDFPISKECLAATKEWRKKLYGMEKTPEFANGNYEFEPKPKRV